MANVTNKELVYLHPTRSLSNLEMFVEKNSHTVFTRLSTAAFLNFQRFICGARFHTTPSPHPFDAMLVFKHKVLQIHFTFVHRLQDPGLRIESFDLVR